MITMIITVIKESDFACMYHHKGMTSFRGCQCFGDCTCAEDFVPKPIDYYLVKRKSGNYKTTSHQTLESANERWDFLYNLNEKKEEK